VGAATDGDQMSGSDGGVNASFMPLVVPGFLVDGKDLDGEASSALVHQ